MKSHIKEEYINTETMDDMALLMQYFRKHDLDGNHKLDGLELLKAISRMSAEDDHDHDHEEQAETQEMEISDVMPIVDEIISKDDKNNDGYISWTEFMAGQRRDKD